MGWPSCETPDNAWPSSWGGAGFGDPCQRPIECVQRDLDDGLITSEGLAEYGCELNQGQVRRGSGVNAPQGRQPLAQRLTGLGQFLLDSITPPDQQRLQLIVSIAPWWRGEELCDRLE